MRYLCETSADIDGLLGGRPTLAARDCSEVEKRWWSSLSKDARPSVREATEPENPFWQTLAVIDDSPVSQFDALVEASRNGTELPSTLACVALTGSGFHGNRERPWKALRGNLHFSSYCRLRLDAARCGPALSMLPTLAVTDVLQPLIGDEVWIKWVNDVYLNDAKISGSLVSTEVNGDVIESFVLGIGVNVEATPVLARPGFVRRVTCLQAEGVQCSLGATLEGLMSALARRIGQLRDTGPEALSSDYRHRAGAIGRQVSLYLENASEPEAEEPLASGRLLDIRPDLSLKIEGCAEAFRSGRILLATEDLPEK